MSGVWSHGKGDIRRQCRTGAEERQIREQLAHGIISPTDFQSRYRELLAQGKITRDGRVMRG